jgi:hypothetical protein
MTKVIISSGFNEVGYGLGKRGKIASAKHKFYISSKPADQTEAIDALASYGEQAVGAITEVINLFDISEYIRGYGQEAIEDIKGHS